MKNIFSSVMVKRVCLMGVIIALGALLAFKLLEQRALTVPSPVTPVILAADGTPITLAPYARLFHDGSAMRDYAAIRAEYNAGGGDKPEHDRITLDGASAHWLIFTVKNDTDTPTRWMLDLGRRVNGATGVADDARFYSDNVAAPLMHDGRRVMNKRHMTGQDKNALPLDIDANRARTFALRLEPAPGLPLTLTPRLLPDNTYQAQNKKLATADNLINIALLIMGSLSVAMMLRFNSLTPPLLAIYVAAQATVYRNADEVIAFGNNTGATLLEVLAAAAGITGLMLTQRIFFGTDANRNIIYRLISTACAVLALLGMAALVSPVAAKVASPALLRLLPVLLPAAVVAVGVTTALRRTYAPLAHIYTIGWAFLFVAAALAEAGMTGIAAQDNADLYWPLFALHLVLVSFAALYFTFTGEAGDHARLVSALQREQNLTDNFNAAEERHRKELSESQAIAEAATKSRADFLAIVSHEIRTPMTGIMGMIRLLIETPLTDKQREYIDALQYSCNALLALINDILDFSKVGVGRMDIEEIDFDIRRLTDGVIHLMATRAAEKNLTLKAEVDPAVRPFFKGDPTRLRQILLNLIGNAIKFTDKGGVTLIIKAAGFDDHSRQMVYFAVRDTGVGMSKDVLAKVFVPYAQGHASIARRYGGTGLGLSISQQLVSAMGGTVEVSSELGSGTTFFFTLALTEGQEENTIAAEDEIPAIPLRVLIVDDNPINRKVVTGLLERDAHDLSTAAGGQEAFDAVRDRDFDVVLMDMEMPDVDGPMAARMIRALPDPVKSRVPIVAMTSNTAPEDIALCLDAGMNDHCRKPVDLPQLRALLLQVAKQEGAFTPDVTGRTAPQPVEAQNTAATPATPAAAPLAADAPQQKLFNPEILGTLKTSMSRAQMDDMMKGFYEKTEELIATAENAVAAHDPKAISGRAHDIKGMTANFGLIALSEVAAKLSRQAKEGADAETLQETVKQLRPVYAETRKIVEQWVSS